MANLHDNLKANMAAIVNKYGLLTKREVKMTKREIPSGQDGAILPARDFSLGPARSKIIFWCFKSYNKSFIDQDCSVKMTGYWPRSFFACLWTSTSSRSINTQKKNLANIQSS